MRLQNGNKAQKERKKERKNENGSTSEYKKEIAKVKIRCLMRSYKLGSLHMGRSDKDPAEIN